MNDNMTIEYKVHFKTSRRSRKVLCDGEKKPSVAVGRIPRVSRLMALAIRFDGLIRDGVVADQAELARLGHVTRARMTQIMNLLSLAPDIQEDILFLPPVFKGRDGVMARRIRMVAAMSDWRMQRRVWRDLGVVPTS